MEQDFTTLESFHDNHLGNYYILDLDCKVPVTAQLNNSQLQSHLPGVGECLRMATIFSEWPWSLIEINEETALF